MSKNDEKAPKPSQADASANTAPDPSATDPCATDACASDRGEDAEPPIEPAGEAAGPGQELAQAREEAAEFRDRFIRASAELDNIRKRHQRELSERARYDGASLAAEILPAVDDLERALEHAGEGSAGVSGGVEMVLKGLLAALKRNGVERIEAAGKAFDPAEHEAVAMVDNAEVAPNTVVSVFRAGYRMHDRLLRAAMVSVSKAPAAPASEGEEGKA